MPRAYDHFRRDATDFIRQNHADWTAVQTQNTISTIWAGVDAVRTHYAGSAGQDQSPSLPVPNHIPARPCTKRDAGHARKTGQLPTRLQGAQQPGGQPQGGQPQVAQPPGGQQQPAQQPPIQQPPAQQPPIQQPPVQQPPVQQSPIQQPAVDQPEGNGHPDRVPYHYWPQMPWETTEHDFHVPTTSTVQPTEDEQHAWLGGRPYFPEGFSEEEDEGMWHGRKYLGGGSYGIVGLWVKTDAENNIERRMVIKDSVPNVLHWRDPHNWRDRVPREVRIHQLVEERRKEDPETCRHLIRYFGHRLHMAQRRYRLYLEFCSFGTLSDAIWKHSDYWVHKETALKEPAKKGARKAPAVEKPVPEVLPEAFIWSVIKALASACLVLQSGTDKDTLSVDGWNPITHLDIQNPNTFLQLHVDEMRPDTTEPDQGDEGSTSSKRKRSGSVTLKGKEPATSAPAAKKARTGSATTSLIPILADFGLSALSPAVFDERCLFKDNPDNYIWSDTHPRYAPEHQFQVEPDTEPLGPKTDVWGIGNVAWQLIVNRISPFGPAREDVLEDNSSRVKYDRYIPVAWWYYATLNRERHTEETLLSGRYFPASDSYSEQLKQLVRDCLSWRTEHRPELKEVYDYARAVLENDLDADATLSDIRGLGLALPDEDDFRIGQPAPARHIER